MKHTEISTINRVVLCDRHGNQRSCWAVEPIIDDRYKHDGYENVPVLFKGTVVPWIDGDNCRDNGKAVEERFLFLEDYGEEMPPDMKKRLDLDFTAIVVRYRDSRVYGLDPARDTPGEVYLRPIGVLRPVGRDERANVAKVFANLNTKRPYHFEIDWWSVQAYLEGEEGWTCLRRGAKVVVRTNKRRYEARRENE